MIKPIWFPFYSGDFLASSKVAMMETAEIGAYVLLLCHAWASEDCSLPIEEEKLRKLSRFSGDFSQILSCFSVKHGKLYNDRLLFEWKKVKLNKEIASKSGRQGADKRWPQRITGTCVTPVTGPVTGFEHSSPSPSEESKEKTPLPPKGVLTVVDVMTVWNATPGVKQAKSVTGLIKKTVERRINEHPNLQWFQDLFQRVSQSDFLTGRSTDFTATLDWVLGPKNLAKINNGNYDNRELLTQTQFLNGAAQVCQHRVQRGNFLRPCGELSVVAIGGQPRCQTHKEEYESRNSRTTT